MANGATYTYPQRCRRLAILLVGRAVAGTTTLSLVLVPELIPGLFPGLIP
jgi:hypothetical protein